MGGLENVTGVRLSKLGVGFCRKVWVWCTSAQVIDPPESYKIRKEGASRRIERHWSFFQMARSADSTKENKKRFWWEIIETVGWGSLSIKESNRRSLGATPSQVCQWRVKRTAVILGFDGCTANGSQSLKVSWGPGLISGESSCSLEIWITLACRIQESTIPSRPYNYDLSAETLNWGFGATRPVSAH